MAVFANKLLSVLPHGKVGSGVCVLPPSSLQQVCSSGPHSPVLRRVALPASPVTARACSGST